MKPHPIGLYLLCVILAKFCKAQNGYHYNRPAGRPFSPTTNNQIPNSNQKLSGTYQPQGSQRSYQNELSPPSGYQYNRPSSKYQTTPSPQSQTVGFPQPFRPNSGTVRPFLGSTNPTTFRGIANTEFSGTTSNPAISGGTPEDRTAGLTSSPLNSRGSLGAGTSPITSSPLNVYSSSQPSSNGNYNYHIPASTSFMPNRDYGNYQPVSDTNTILSTGFDNGSNNHFGISPSTQQPSGSGVENIGNTATGNQPGSLGYNNFNSGPKGGDLGTNAGYSGNGATSTPVRENLIPVSSYTQRPGTSNTASYNQNSGIGLGPSNTYNKNPESVDTTGSNVGNNGISNSNEQYSENLIPQGTSNFGPGTVGGYGSNTYLETQKPNSFNVGNTGASESNNVYGSNSGPQRPSNLNNGDSNNRGSSTGYGGNSGLTSASSGGLDNIGSNNAYGGLPDNQISGNSNAVDLGNSGSSNGYDNFGPQEPNNALLGDSQTSKPNTFSSGNNGDNTFNGNLGQQEPNNAIEGSFGSQSPTYTSAGNQGSQNPTNVLESGTGFPGSSNSFGGNGGLQGLGSANAGNSGNTVPNFSATTRPQGTEDNGSTQNGDYSAIPGTPDLDYPVLSEIPPTKFSCNSQKYPGYYADVEARCQVFHICANGLKYDFLCPNGTVFHQKYFVCVWWNQFECNSAESLYSLNENLYDYDKMGSLIANAAGATGAQGPSVPNTLGFGPQGSSTNWSPSTGSPINFTPSSGVEGPSINYGSPSQAQAPSSNFEALAGPQGSSTISSFAEPSSNYGSPSQQQGSLPNTGSSITPHSTSSSFESSDGLQSSSGGFTPPPDYERPSTNYDYVGPLQSHSSNLGSSATPPGQSVDYGSLSNPQGSSNNNYEQSSGQGGESASKSSPSFQGYSSTFGSSPDLQGSSASYPGYQGIQPLASVGSFSSQQSPSTTYSPYPPQNSATNFGSFAQPQGITNTGRPPLSSQESANYEPSHGSQSFSNNFGNSDSPQGSSGYSRPSTKLQEPVAYFGPNSNPQSSYDSSGGLPESSTNVGQIGGHRGFISTNSPLTVPLESTTEYYASPAQQSFSGNVNPSAGITSSSDNYPQSSGFQGASSNNYGPPTNSQRPSSIYKPTLDPYPGHQFSSGLNVQPQISGSSHNSPGTSPSFVLPAGSSSSSSNYSPSSNPQGNFANLGQQTSLQKPSPSYGPPSNPSSNFGSQQSSIFDSTPNPQRSFSSYSSTPSPPGQSSFKQPSASQITTASFSPLFNRPSFNYGSPANPSGSTFVSNFGGSQGSSPAPFTLAETSQRPSTVYGPPQSTPLNAPRPQLNYNPSGVNQQSDFSNSAPSYGGSNNEQSLNYPTTIGPNRPFDATITEQPSTYSNSGYPNTAVTSPDSFSSPFSSLSTVQPKTYSTESNIPSNTFSSQESSYPGYNRETILHSNPSVLSSNQQVLKPNREYLPPFRKRR